LAELVWNVGAIRDLDRLADFIAEDSIEAAERQVARIRRAVERLRRFPESGRVVPEQDDKAVRELILGRYRIFHRIEGEAVRILAVQDAPRRLPLDRL